MIMEAKYKPLYYVSRDICKPYNIYISFFFFLVGVSIVF